MDLHSVGFSQPWDLVVVRDRGVRERVRRLVAAQRPAFAAQRPAFAATLAATLPAARARAFAGRPVEAVLETPVDIAVTADPTRGGRHALGRHQRPEMSAHSARCAVQNLWLAAGAAGRGRCTRTATGAAGCPGRNRWTCSPRPSPPSDPRTPARGRPPATGWTG